RPRLVIADARIDQDVVARRLDDEALHAQHQPAAGRIDEHGLQPGAVLLEELLGERREEFEHVEERPLLLDDRINRDVLECDCRRHGDALLRLIEIRQIACAYARCRQSQPFSIQDKTWPARASLFFSSIIMWPLPSIP